VTTLALVHSPLVGPATWAALAAELRSRRFDVVVPDLGEAEARPHWRWHAERAALAMRQLSTDDDVVLVGHSAAGALLPAIRMASGRRVSAYVFVDAALPDGRMPRRGAGPFAQRLLTLYAEGRRFPEWTDADLADVVPDRDRRGALLGELRPPPEDFWSEVVPVFAGWPDAPCGYLAFVPNHSYDAARAEARARGWPYREMQAAHFHMLVDAVAVADALLELVREMGIRATD
jgi:pimeloyl-ACP methyl ester carboxylesterase